MKMYFVVIYLILSSKKLFLLIFIDYPFEDRINIVLFVFNFLLDLDRYLTVFDAWKIKKVVCPCLYICDNDMFVLPLK